MKFFIFGIFPDVGDSTHETIDVKDEKVIVVVFETCILLRFATFLFYFRFEYNSAICFGLIQSLLLLSFHFYLRSFMHIFDIIMWILKRRFWLDIFLSEFRLSCLHCIN